jgi:CheY-like chemotaxis protein
MLVGVRFHSEMAQSHCKGNSDAEPLLDRARELLDEVVQKSRDLSHELSPATFRTQGLSGGLKWLAEQMRRQHQIDVGVHLEGDVDEVAEAIRILLYKSIREMLFNIVKHAEVDHAVVVVTREPSHVEVVVQDHGAGFDVDAVLCNKSGHGLGLFSIRERLNLLGGRLDVESTRGEGSNFRLFVPLTQKQIEEATGEARQEGEPAAPGPAATRQMPIRVIIADDHAIVREGIAHLLGSNLRIEVIDEADNGQEVLDKVAHHRPDLVLMDYAMPVLDGVEATRRIAADYPDVRVVGVSMYHEQAMADQMLEAGADAFVQKTAPASDLIATIQQVSGDHASQDTMGKASP